MQKGTMNNIYLQLIVGVSLFCLCNGQNYSDLMLPVVTMADLFDPEPMIFTANYAFEGIQGVEGAPDEDAVRAAGGGWVDIAPACESLGYAGVLKTTTNSPNAVATSWGYPTYLGDAMPVVFSWPVLPSTVNNTDFELELNTGEKVFPDVASISPNFEYNERQTVVIFGLYGNRIDHDKPGAVWVKTVTIVDDGTPLMLVGPNGKLFNAVGLTYDASCCKPYGPGAQGPRLVAAKLNKMKDVTGGEVKSSNDPLGNPLVYDNSCIDLYGNATTYRLRLFTSGGFSPNGVSGMRPDHYKKYFRVHAETADGETVLLSDPEVEYTIGNAGSIKILGMADLGKIAADGNYDCYISDNDNQIDICMVGDEAAMRRIVAVEMPHGNTTADPTNEYEGLYNPGGPGNSPTPGVNYTQPSGWQLQSVMLALDDPMVTTYPPENTDEQAATPMPPTASPSAPASSSTAMPLAGWTLVIAGLVTQFIAAL